MGNSLHCPLLIGGDIGAFSAPSFWNISCPWVEAEAVAQQGAAIAGLQRAGGLADRTRGIPYQTRMEALRGLNRAGAGIPGIMGATQQNIYGAAQSLGGTGGQFDPNTIQKF